MAAFLEKYSTIVWIVEILYVLGIIFLSGKIIKDTKTVSKTLAYLLLIIFLPIIGVIIYFLFGINFKKNKFYNFKIQWNEDLYKEITQNISHYHQEVLETSAAEIRASQNTINFLFEALHSPLTYSNHVEILKNGETKFPKVLEILKKAEDHIHLEYYIYENDSVGQAIAEVLKEKAQQGIKVRFLYDDFGSRKIGKEFLNDLRASGVEALPVNKIRFKLLANRINYRDHRKIIIVDGEHVFTGGINISERYQNPNPKQYWRDTHLYIQGNAAFYYQYLFLTNWIFAQEKLIPHPEDFFKPHRMERGDTLVQVAAGGPDIKPGIMLSTTSSIYEAKKRIYITTPYFIPVEDILNALKIQALAGVDVRLLVPKEGDSALVNAAAYSYYSDLLENKVRIYFYEKGFIHAKTILIDDHFVSIGTANMDIRSQELNFEVNTHIYSQKINRELLQQFRQDLEESTELDAEVWKNRPKLKIFFEHLARLLSPLL